MHVDGACHCGAIRFEAEIDPERAGLCHCTDCQIFSGAAFRTSVLVEEADMHHVAGEPAIYQKTSEAGRPRHLAFCGRCGTHVYGISQGDGPRTYSVRVGTLAQRAEIGPAVQVWTRSSVPWIDDLARVPKIETQPGA